MSGQSADAEKTRYYSLALRMAPGVGARNFHRLVERFGTPEKVLRAGRANLGGMPGLRKSTVDALARFDWGDRVDEQMALARRRGYRMVLMDDAEYPLRLKEIYDPPPFLWVAGRFEPTDEAAVAIVGSRGGTDWGRQAAARIATDLAGAGIMIVSGCALGIDAAAHRGALEAGGRTVGVLGCGLDVIYPRPNRDLYETIPGSGALVSEFPLGTRPQPGHFPMRNRIISGLAAAVIVVEAGEKSGALITARLALDQNRDVMAVPGRAGSMKSRGTNALIREGAALVESGADVLEELDGRLGPGRAPRPAATRRLAPEHELTLEEKAVYEILGENDIHVDELGRRLGLTPDRLAPILLNMELAGLIRQSPGNRYART